MAHKSLAVNSIYSVIYKLLNVLFPLITATYAARTLLADGVGKVSYAQNIVQYFVIIAALGIPNYGIREIAKGRDSRIVTDQVFSELFVINAVSTAACVAVYYGMVFGTPIFAEQRLLFATVGLSLILNFLNVDWFYQGREEYGYIAARSFAVKVLSLVLLFALVRDTDDFVVYALLHSLATAGNYLFNILNLRGKVKLTLRNIRVRRHLKPVMVLLASSISIELYTLLDTTMLGIWCSDSVVGYYNNATKLARIINSVISSIALVLLPRLSYYYNNGMLEEFSSVANRVMKILVALSVPAVLGVFLLADPMVPILFGESFLPSVTTLRILSPLVMAVALNNFFGTQILMTVGQEKKLLLSVVIGAVVNLILNSFLIRAYAQNGAAFASAVSEICVLLATMLFAKRYARFETAGRFWITMFSAAGCMTLAVLGIKLTELPPLVELAGGIGVGVAVYFLVGRLLRNESVQEILSIGSRLAGKLRRR